MKNVWKLLFVALLCLSAIAQDDDAQGQDQNEGNQNDGTMVGDRDPDNYVKCNDDGCEVCIRDECKCARCDASY